MKKFLTLVLVLCALNSFSQIQGELNTSFGTDGSYIFEPSIAHDFIEKILVQNDGKILTVGKARADGNNYSIYVSRHNADGTLDETYRDGGIAFFKVIPNIYMNCAFDAELNDEGLLFVTGYTFDYNNNTAFILCLDENGFEHTYFGDNGYAISDYGHGIVYEAIDIDTEGRPIVTGYYDDQILVRRHEANGTLDSTFGDNGTSIIILDSTPWAYCYAYDIEALEDGKILVAGHKVSADMLYESYLLRLNADGSLDNTFADNGVLYINAGEYAEYATTIDVQADGKYLVGGHDDLLTYAPYPRCESYITRVNTDGTIDMTFGNEGFVRIEQFSGDGCTNECYSIMAAPDGQIFGTVYSFNHYSLASRAYVYNLDENGQYREDFAGCGFMVLPQLDDEEMKITTSALALLNDNNILVGGHIAVGSSSNHKLFISCVNVDIENGEAIEEFASSLLLYPNPANDKLHIATESKIEDIAVYDVFGRRQAINDNGEQTSTIVVSNLNSGVYFVVIKSDNKNIIERFVKR